MVSLVTADGLEMTYLRRFVYQIYYNKILATMEVNVKSYFELA